MNAPRRVKQLHIKATSYADFQHASIIVEDALRTASLPGLPKNGLLLIRRLDLGKLSSTADSKFFSQIIDQRILALRPLVICRGQEDQPHAGIVWFPDSIEPYALLAGLLSKGMRPSAWYWQLAVPELKPLAADDSDCLSDLVQIMVSVSETANGTLVISSILERLINETSMEKLLAHISDTDARLILKNLGIDTKRFHNGHFHNEPLVATENGFVPHFSADWRDAIARTSLELTVNDNRLILLIFAAIQCNRLIATHSDLTVVLQSVANLAQRSIQNVAQSARSPAQKEDSGDENALTDEVSDQSKQDLANTRVYQSQNEDSYQHSPDIGLMQIPGAFSESAGLPLLINVLQGLRFDTLLQDFPLLAELDLPAQVIWACAIRAAVDEKDSACHWLTPRDLLPVAETSCSFVMLERWLPLLYTPYRPDVVVIRRILSEENKYLMTDNSGKVAIALWEDDMPYAIASLVEHRQILRLAPLQHINDLQIITNTCLFAVRRYLWRYARLGLAGLIRRNGRIAVTRTHLDISFSLNDVDIDVRKAGLDIDPGWVKWLGRVINIHYLEEAS